jgi:hypothetical protein
MPMPTHPRPARLLAALMLLAAGACQDFLGSLRSPPDPYYLLLGGGATEYFAPGDEVVPVLGAASDDAAIARVETLGTDGVSLVGVTEGETRVTVSTDRGTLAFRVIVQAADRFELVRRNFPWAPCTRFVPGSTELIDDAAWLRGEQELNGRPPSPTFSTTDAAVATVTTGEFGESIISYVAPGAVTLLSDGVPGPARDVVATNDLASLALWAECGDLVIDEGRAVAPLWIDCPTTSFIVVGRDPTRAMVCLEGTQEVQVEPPADDSCQFSPTTSTVFNLHRSTPGTCDVTVTLGESAATVSVPFGSDGP